MRLFSGNPTDEAEYVADRIDLRDADLPLSPQDDPSQPQPTALSGIPRAIRPAGLGPGGSGGNGRFTGIEVTDARLQLLAGPERHDTAGPHGNLLSCPRIAGHASLATLDLENPEVSQFHPSLPDERLHECLERGLYHIVSSGLRQIEPFRDGPDDVFLGHGTDPFRGVSPPQSFQTVAGPTTLCDRISEA